MSRVQLALNVSDIGEAVEFYSTTTTKPQSVWSAGDGDFLDMLGQGPKKQTNQEMALSSATGIFGAGQGENGKTAGVMDVVRQ